jgi:hypothetical protein
MKTAYRFKCDYGRCGNVHRVFIATPEEVAKAIGSEVYFGEILGKHSEIYGELSSGDLETITNDPSDIETIERLGLTSGYNPLKYIRQEDEE